MDNCIRLVSPSGQYLYLCLFHSKLLRFSSKSSWNSFSGVLSRVEDTFGFGFDPEVENMSHPDPFPLIVVFGSGLNILIWKQWKDKNVKNHVNVKLGFLWRGGYLFFVVSFYLYKRRNILKIKSFILLRQNHAKFTVKILFFII